MYVRDKGFILMFGLSCDFEMLIKHSLFFNDIKPISNADSSESLKSLLRDREGDRELAQVLFIRGILFLRFLSAFRGKKEEIYLFRPLEHLRRFIKIAVYKTNLL